MIVDKNNMHDIDTFMFFKWTFKSAAAAIIVNHTFDFIIAIFQVAQTMVQRSAGVIDTNASIDISTAIADITTQLQAMGLGDLFAPYAGNMDCFLCYESHGTLYHGHPLWTND